MADGALLKIMLCLIMLTIPGGCVSHDEVARVRSPSGKIDAVLVENNGGATTTFSYSVFILASSNKTPAWNRVAVLDGAFRNENAYGVNLVWRGPTLLVMEFMDAKGVKIEKSTVVIDGTQVQVALQRGVKDPSAPSGGMLYNLKRKGTL